MADFEENIKNQSVLWHSLVKSESKAKYSTIINRFSQNLWRGAVEVQN